MIMFDIILDYLYKAMDWYENFLLPIARPLGEVLMALSFVGLVADAFLWHGAQEIPIAFFLIIGAVLRQVAIWNEQDPRPQQPML